MRRLGAWLLIRGRKRIRLLVYFYTFEPFESDIIIPLSQFLVKRLGCCHKHNVTSIGTKSHSILKTPICH